MTWLCNLVHDNSPCLCLAAPERVSQLREIKRHKCSD